MMVKIFLALVVNSRKIVFHGEIRLAREHCLGITARFQLIAHLGVGGREKGLVRVVRRGDALEGLDSLSIAMGDEISSPEMIPEPLGVIWIEAHRLFNPVDALVGPSKPGQYFS